MANILNEWYDTDEAYRELANGIVIQAVEDWKQGWKDLQKQKNCITATRLMNDSERFFHSDWYKTLCNYPVKDLMNRLPEMAKKELYEYITNLWTNAYIVTKVLKPGTKTNDKKIANAYKRMNMFEEEMWSKYFIKLYHKHPVDLIRELTEQADKRIENEAERKRQEELAKKRARENEMSKSSRKKRKAV